MAEAVAEQGTPPSETAAPSETAETKVAEIAQETKPETVEAGKTEETNPDEQKPAEKPDKFAQKFAALSRKEREIRQRETSLKAREQEIEVRLAKAAEIEALPSKVKESPLEALERLGVTYDQLTELILQQGQEKPEDKKLAEIERKIADYEKREREAVVQRQEQARQSYLAELSAFCKSSDKYELIQANSAVPVVYQVVEEHYNKTGEILTNEQAADLVESHLEEEAAKLLKLNKIKAKLAPPAAQPTAPVANQSTAKTNSTTLTNSLQSTSPTREPRKLTDEEALEEAARLIKWTA